MMDFALPAIGEGVYEAELVRWLVQPGATVKRGQVLLEVLTDKATMEVPAPFAGTVATLKAEPGQMIRIGEVVLDYTPAGASSEPVPTATPERTASAPATVTMTTNGPTSAAQAVSHSVKAAPSVRYMARKMGVDLGSIAGSGPEGRILLEDISRLLDARLQTTRQPARPAAPPADFGKPGTRIKLAGLRRRIAEHMVHSTHTIPHYSYVDECDATELVRLRNTLKEAHAQAGIKLTYLAFLVKAVAAALRDVPLVNASLDEKAGEIVLHDRYHIGIAVATPAGLIVPVVHDANRKDLGTIARDIERLSSEARAGRSRLEDLRGGTFTVTSVGNIGGLISTPVINHPEVGILGIGKVIRRPVYDEAGQIRPADLMYLSFSFDHRVVDGAVGAAFGNAVLRRLQAPALLLLPDRM